MEVWKEKNISTENVKQIELTKLDGRNRFKYVTNHNKR